MGLLRGFSELILPPACFACGARSLNPLCRPCETAIEPIEDPVCPVCGRPVLYEVKCCARCKADKPAFDAARALAPYDFPMREVVLGMKSRQGRGLADFMAGRLCRAFPAEMAGADAFTYVPVSPGRMMNRGFNQAAELAYAAGGLTGKPVLDALRMVRRVKDQAQLPPRERRDNVRGAFAAKRKGPVVAGLDLVLFDDVMTTGNTASACANALKVAGAARVTVLVLARGTSA